MKLTVEVETQDDKADLFWQILSSLSFVETVQATDETKERLPDWQNDLIERRVAAHEANADKTGSWSELGKEIKERYRF